MFKKVVATFFAAIFLLSCPAFAKGGKLDSFEKKLEQKESSGTKHHQRHRHYDPYSYGTYDSDAGSTELITRTWWDLLAMFMLAGIQTQGIYEGMSMSEMHKALKAARSPIMPTIKLDANYQYVFDSIHGYDATLTLGYMMFGADVNMWHLFETNPSDQLKFISPHVLLRFAPFGFMEVDLALGSKIVVGNHTNYGFEAGLPAYFFFSKNIIWDIKTYGSYINGRDLWDVSSGLNFKFGYVGIRAGYRMIELDGDYTHGPQAGIFGQW